MFKVARRTWPAGNRRPPRSLSSASLSRKEAGAASRTRFTPVPGRGATTAEPPLVQQVHFGLSPTTLQPKGPQPTREAPAQQATPLARAHQEALPQCGRRAWGHWVLQAVPMAPMPGVASLRPAAPQPTGTLGPSGLGRAGAVTVPCREGHLGLEGKESNPVAGSSPAPATQQEGKWASPDSACADGGGLVFIWKCASCLGRRTSALAGPAQPPAQRPGPSWSRGRAYGARRRVGTGSRPLRGAEPD